MKNINNQSQSLDKIAGLEDLDHENAAVCSGGSIDLFDGANLTGFQVSSVQNIPDLRNIPGVGNFNDRATSIGSIPFLQKHFKVQEFTGLINIKKLVKTTLAVILATVVFFSSSLDALAGCQRITDDAGRWEDPQSPSGRITSMCTAQLDFHQAQEGKMIFVKRNGTDCLDLANYAKAQESWHGDWFLWSEIKCDNGMMMFIK